MKSEALLQYEYPGLIVFAFLLFFICFLGILLWTFQKSRQDHFKKMADLPLVNDKRQGAYHE